MEKLNSSVDICLGWLSTQLCTATANSERNLKKKWFSQYFISELVVALCIDFDWKIDFLSNTRFVSRKMVTF